MGILNCAIYEACMMASWVSLDYAVPEDVHDDPTGILNCAIHEAVHNGPMGILNYAVPEAVHDGPMGILNYAGIVPLQGFLQLFDDQALLLTVHLNRVIMLQV
jgi:hypothetical protein